MPVIGFLHSRSLESMRDKMEAFAQGLAETGFVEGRNVAIEHRWGEGQVARRRALLADLVRRKVSLIIADTTNGGADAKAATQTIPISFTAGADPIEFGLVSSLGHPGSNATGIALRRGRVRCRGNSAPMIGFLYGGRQDDPNMNMFRGAFYKGLREQGFVEGRNVEILYRNAETQYDRLPSLAVVNRPVNVIVAVRGTVTALAAKAATPIIPIVFANGGDPVQSGLVASARPTGRSSSAGRCWPGAVKLPNPVRSLCRPPLRSRLRGCPPAAISGSGG
jgi:ABC-type uncharacterized transport system substrate-binding protein